MCINNFTLQPLTLIFHVGRTGFPTRRQPISKRKALLPCKKCNVIMGGQTCHSKFPWQFVKQSWNSNLTGIRAKTCCNYTNELQAKDTEKDLIERMFFQSKDCAAPQGEVPLNPHWPSNVGFTKVLHTMGWSFYYLVDVPVGIMEDLSNRVW